VPEDASVDSGAADPEPPTKLHISVIQLLASVGAAVSATFVAAFFGVSGTIIGAAVASSVTVLGNNIYSHSLRRTRERVRQAMPDLSLGSLAKATRRVGDDRPAASEPARRRWWRPRLPRYPRWVYLAASAVALFAVVAGVVTAVELGTGRSIDQIVRNDNRGDGGTSFFGGRPRISRAPSQPVTTQTSDASLPPPSATPTVSTSAATAHPPTTSASATRATTPPQATPSPTPTTPQPTVTVTVTAPPAASPSVEATSDTPAPAGPEVAGTPQGIE